MAVAAPARIALGGRPLSLQISVRFQNAAARLTPAGKYITRGLMASSLILIEAGQIVSVIALPGRLGETKMSPSAFIESPNVA